MLDEESVFVPSIEREPNSIAQIRAYEDLQMDQIRRVVPDHKRVHCCCRRNRRLRGCSTDLRGSLAIGQAGLGAAATIGTCSDDAVLACLEGDRNRTTTLASRRLMSLSLPPLLLH